MNRSIRTRVAAGVATLVAAAGVVAVGGLTNTAGAAEVGRQPVQYDAVGNAHINRGNYNVPIGPTKLRGDIYSDTTRPDNEIYFEGSLPIPVQEVTFKAFGYLPVRAKVVLTQVGDVDATLTLGATTSAKATAKYDVTLRDVYVGYSRANVGSNCKTVKPVDVALASDPGFDLAEGSLSGTFDLGKVANCGTSTELANLIVPSTNNSIKVALSNIQLQFP